jgi:archaellum component FlaG (FlaF/FlaG flagellin family)
MYNYIKTKLNSILSLLDNQTHLQQKNTTYISHLKNTIQYSYKLNKASIAVLIHGFIPSMFENTASNIVSELNTKMNTNLDVESKEEIKKD